MKKAREILELLCVDLTIAIADITARIKPAVHHHGLEEIPDEVLADILVRDSWDYLRRGIRHKELKRVNKRFWSIISSTPLCSSHVGWIANGWKESELNNKERT